MIFLPERKKSQSLVARSISPRSNEIPRPLMAPISHRRRERNLEVHSGRIFSSQGERNREVYFGRKSRFRAERNHEVYSGRTFTPRPNEIPKVACGPIYFSAVERIPAVSCRVARSICPWLRQFREAFVARLFRPGGRKSERAVGPTIFLLAVGRFLLARNPGSLLRPLLPTAGKK